MTERSNQIIGIVLTAIMFVANVALSWFAPGVFLPAVGMVVALISGIILTVKVADL